MPQRRNSTPPEVMTWPKAAPILIVAGIADVLRAFFHFFWFFGPAVAIFYCTLSVSERLSSWTLGLLGTKTAFAACTAGGAAVGAAGVEIIGPFGVIMAGATGFIAFLVLGLWVSMRNMRILKVVSGAPIQFAGIFAASEVPFLGALPFFSYILWRLYGKQIRIEKADFKKWEQETSAARLEERNKQTAQIIDFRAARQARLTQQEQQERARAEAEATSVAGDEIPEDERMAA